MTKTEVACALRGEYGDDPQRIAEVGVEWLTTLINKNVNYGSSVWKPPALAPDMPVRSAILVRMSDKVARIASLMSGDVDRVGESLDDTIGDLGAYCLLYLARPKEKAPDESEAMFDKWEGLFVPPTGECQ